MQAWNYIKKVKKYIEVKFLQKYFDNQFWNVVDESNFKVATITRQIFNDEIKTFYPKKDIEKQRIERIDIYNFIILNFTKYLFKVADCIVEPQYSWVILGNKNIFLYSFPMVEDPWDKVKARPSVIRYRLNSKYKHLDEAILIKYNWANYYHFLIDVIGQLNVADELGLNNATPVLVPHNAFQNKHVREYFELFPCKRKIIIQEENEYYKIKNLYLAKDAVCTKKICLFKENVKSIIAKLDADITISPEYLFVTRRKEFKRVPRNINQLEEIALKSGFTVIEPGDFSFIRQLKLFSNARCVIGIHGAALTNIVFSKQKNLKLFEIFPGGGLNPEHYENICMVLGYEYNSIHGDGIDAEGYFNVDSNKFSNEIKLFFN